MKTTSCVSLAFGVVLLANGGWGLERLKHQAPEKRVNVTSIAAAWRTFKSRAGFRVAYPATWHIKGLSAYTLTVLSPGEGATALLIDHGQASITTSSLRLKAGRSADSIEEEFLKDGTVQSRENLQSSKVCDSVKKRVFTQAAVPAEDVPIPVPYIVNTALFCRKDDRLYTINLRYYQGDDRQREFEAIELQMFASLQVNP